MADIKVPPHSQTAEQSVLGAVLLDKDAVVAVVEFLLPEHFYDDKHQLIFKVISDLYQEREPVDVVSVTERLKKNKDKTVGGSQYLTELGTWCHRLMRNITGDWSATLHQKAVNFSCAKLICHLMTAVM
jgi:replicative DNA helicase